jgi:hypothetical protein
MSAEAILNDFEEKLILLKDWPDKALIHDLTRYTEIYISLAE